MAIFFHEENVYSGLNRKRAIKLWIKNVIILENKIPGIINIILTSDEDLRKINIDYLERDYFTDIITFNYTENRVISGDLFISLDRVNENALKYTEDRDIELLRVMIHGVLHLIGYDDSSIEDKKLMREKENNCLTTFAG